MNKPVVIVGAGRQGRVTLDVLDSVEMTVAGFLDDTRPVGSLIHGRAVLNGFAAMRDPAFVHNHAFTVALGDNPKRQELCRALLDARAALINAIHPTAQIARSSVVGQGVFLGPFVSVAPDSTLGDFVLIERQCGIGVDVRIGEAALVGPGVIVTGGASVGPLSFLGAGAVVSNGVSVGAECVVGANSVVTRDLPDGATARGAPARRATMRRPFVPR